MIVLDTDIVLEPLKPEPSEHVMAWASRHADDLAITSVTVGELLTGIAFLPEGARKQALLKAVGDVTDGLVTCLPYDEPAAHAYAKLRGVARRAGRGLSAEDGMIAAICAANGATLATRNTADLDFLGIQLVNPWRT